MTALDYLQTAKSHKNRKNKVFWLFEYKKSKNITHSKPLLIEMIGYTDEQIEIEINDYISQEIKSKHF